MNKKVFLDAAIGAAKLVRPVIMDIYLKGFDVEIKEDNSPVTNADKLADVMIVDYLSNLFPDHGFLTEESVDNHTRLDKDFVWIIDPIDGTQDFVNKNGEFATNIALSYKNQIIVGVILSTVKNEIFYAVAGEGSYVIKENGEVSRIYVSNDVDNLITVTSRNHIRESEKTLIKNNKRISTIFPVGASLKACLIASGAAHIFYRMGSGTKEWDTAPCDLLVKEAGGVFEKPDGTSYTYNRVDVANREGYVMANKKENIIYEN